MTTKGARALLPLETSPWREMYREAARWVISSAPVVDLGCGTGRFAAALAEAGHNGGYTGLDFAPAVVGEAARYAPGNDYRVQDLTEWQPDDIRVENTTYVCLEVLEHIPDDLDLIRRVPGGHRFVFSVPNYGSTSHVRRFPAPAAIWDRYGSFLTFRRWSLLAVSTTNQIHLVDTYRRVDSWQ